MMKTPKPYQLKALKKMNLLAGRCIVAQDMGLGKTFQFILWARLQDDEALPIILICPSIVKWQWEAEIRAELQVSAFVCSGRKPPRSERERAAILRHKVLIINYEILKDWVPLLLKLKAKTICLDEAHRIKNIASKTFRYCEKLALTNLRKPVSKARTDFCVALTGTPLTSHPIELWPIVHLTHPRLFPDRFKYAWRFCAPKKHPWGWNLNGNSRKKVLHKILRQQVMIRQRKIDCLKDLPAKIRTVVPLAISDRKEYAEAEKDILAWMAKKDPGKAKRAKRAIAMIRLGQLKKLAAELKAPQVIEWIREFLNSNPGEKLTVYGHHIDFLKTLKDGLAEYHPVVVNGTVSEKNRKLAIDRFVNQKKCRLFIANMKAAGTGIDGLQRVCQNMAVVELGWTPGEHNQVEDRLWRVGQMRGVNIFYLVALGTVEEQVAAVLYERQMILDAVIDGRNLSKKQERELNNFTIFEEVARRIRKKKAANGKA
jgi:SWI/SNF-related matrix-associated actin-dependent regulator 1 of chromatin subfamily A